MYWSLIARRLLLPILGAMAGACAIIAIYAGARLATLGSPETELPALLWVALVAAIVAAALALLIIFLYSRAQAQAIADSFGRVLPATGIERPATPGSIEDVTEALARSFSRVMAQSQKDQSQLLTIISSMTEGLVALDHEQRILLANRAAEQLLGIKIPDAQNQPIWEHVAVDGVTQAAAQVMLTGRPRSFQTGPHNGIYLDVMVSRLPAAGGLVIVAHDVTEATRYQRLREELV
jgi:two-component system phosphate regulon sensor histidine kinase PhoR